MGVRRRKPGTESDTHGHWEADLTADRPPKWPCTSLSVPGFQRHTTMTNAPQEHAECEVAVHVFLNFQKYIFGYPPWLFWEFGRLAYPKMYFCIF